jgi:hypothetical protein
MASWKILLEPQLPELVSRVSDLKMDHWKDKMMNKIFGVVSMAEMSPIIPKKLKYKHHFEAGNFIIWK